MSKLRIGDTVRVSVARELYYSGLNGNTVVSSEPGWLGVVGAVDVPPVTGRRGKPDGPVFNCVDFVLPGVYQGDEHCANVTWRGAFYDKELQVCIVTDAASLRRETDEDAARWLEEDLFTGCPVSFAFEQLMNQRYGWQWPARLSHTAQLEERITFLFGYLAGLPPASYVNRLPAVLQLKRLLSHREPGAIDQIDLLQDTKGQYDN